MTRYIERPRKSNKIFSHNGCQARSKNIVATRINGYLEEFGQIALDACLLESTEEVELASLLLLGTGYAFRSNTYVANGRYKVLTIKNVQDGIVDCSDANRVDSIPANLKPYSILGAGSVVLSLTGNVGRVGIVAESNCLLNQRVAVIKPNSAETYAALYFLLRSRGLKERMIGIAKGTAQANLSPVETAKLTVPFDEVAFAKFCIQSQPLFDTLLANMQESRKLAQLRDALLPKLMSGEIDVSKVDLTQLNSHLSGC